MAGERHRAVYQLIHRLELLVAGDLLGRRSLLRLEDDEMQQEVEQVCWL